MARPNRYQIMDLYKEDILTELIELNDIVLTLSEIESVLSKNRQYWRLPNSTTLMEFIDFLSEKRKILEPIEFGTESRRQIRYIYTKEHPDAISLALLLYPDLYLSHYSAVMYHDISNEISKSVYVSREQNTKTYRDFVIPQENIDNAFSKPMRRTNNFIDYENRRIYLINSNYSDNLGIIERDSIRVTDIERTLIDITVRPDYSGGIYEVINIFERAKKHISINRIIAYLKKLNYSYPYHQSIGFFLERSGYNNNSLKLLEKSFPFKHDFYLTYDMKDKSYDSRWKIYYPKNL